MSENPYEKQHRFKKATLLAQFFQDSGVTIEQIEKLSSSERSIVASLAGVNTPSEETWILALELTKKRMADPLVK